MKKNMILGLFFFAAASSHIQSTTLGNFFTELIERDVHSPNLNAKSPEELHIKLIYLGLICLICCYLFVLFFQELGIWLSMRKLKKKDEELEKRIDRIEKMQLALVSAKFPTNRPK